MENPEEVLQALDEFQKLRPADIPKELEEYLSWVAKTGDPVYQWPLIKALFREKLLRVMTEFYESCPSLELAPCPNVEQFNYDIMKSALLDRLESFANAPFTVQRICELLTSPRKEYNRVDKFMRAIEKNILVVSTREPGATSRRSENGDGMVNGASEDNGSRSPYDMDLWTRACTLATTVTVQTVETHSTIVNIHNIPSNVIPATELTIVKSNAASVEGFTSYGTEADICDAEMNTKSQDLRSNFNPSTSEIASIANLTSQIQPQDLNSTSGIQNLSNMVGGESSGIVGDVPEAIMNEDTNSQPSLDMENSESEAFETTRKLQTTFQSSDFITHGIKSQKFYSDDSKTTEKTIVEAETRSRNDIEPSIDVDRRKTVIEDEVNRAEIAKENLLGDKCPAENGEPQIPAEVKSSDSIEINENVERIVTDAEPSAESILSIDENNETIDRNDASRDETRTKERVITDNDDTAMVENETESALLDINMEKDGVASSADVNTGDKDTESTTLVSATSESLISCTVDSSVKITPSVIISKETELVTDSNESKVSNKIEEQVAQDFRPDNERDNETDEIRESKDCEEESGKVSVDKSYQPLVSIEKLSCENETKITESSVSDPLPIAQESKDKESMSGSESKRIIVDVTDEEEKKMIDAEVSVSVESEKESTDSVETQSVLKVNPEGNLDAECGEPISTEDPTSVETSSTVLIQDIPPVESMEIDVAEGGQTTRQEDEPMEEEVVGDLDKS